MVKNTINSNNKGLTLIEIIVAMAVTSIIFTLIVGIFVTGIKLNADIHNHLEIQQQAHFIMDFMTNTIMESNKVNKISNYQRIPFYDSSEKIKIGVVEFDDNSLGGNRKHIFSIQKDPKVEGRSIRYGNTEVAKIEAGNYLDSIYMKPLPEGCSYKEARGVEVTIVMKKGRSNITIFKSIYFRRYLFS